MCSKVWYGMVWYYVFLMNTLFLLLFLFYFYIPAYIHVHTCTHIRTHIHILPLALLDGWFLWFGLCTRYGFIFFLHVCPWSLHMHAHAHAHAHTHTQAACLNCMALLCIQLNGQWTKVTNWFFVSRYIETATLLLCTWNFSFQREKI